MTGVGSLSADCFVHAQNPLSGLEDKYLKRNIPGRCSFFMIRVGEVRLPLQLQSLGPRF